MFESEDSDLGSKVCWLVPNAQKNDLEPILVTLGEGGRTFEDEPHEGEEFGYVLSGSVILVIGSRKLKLHKGDNFCFKPTENHYIANLSKREARVLWVVTPPSF